MNKAYKLIKRKVMVSPNIRKTIDLNAEVYSQDIDVTKIVLVLEDDNGEKIDLTDADVRVALQFNNVVIEDRGKVESVEEQSISYSPGERFKYQEGLVTIAFYVTLSTNQRIDISHFKINFKRSLIDSQRAAEELETQFISVNEFIEKEKKSYEKSRLGFNSIVDHTMDEIVEKKKEFDLKMQELQEKIALPDLPSSNSKLYVAYMNSDSVLYKTDTGEFDYGKSFEYENIGISFSNSNNQEDYIWFPAFGAFAVFQNSLDDQIRNSKLHVAYRVPKSMDDPLGDTLFKKASPDDPPSQAMYSNYVGVSLNDSYEEEDYVWFPSLGLISRMINQINSGYTELLSDTQNRMAALEEKPDKDTIYDDSNLKAQIVELQEKLKSLNTVRRAPTGYTLDRTTTPWTIWFDNGCGMTIPEYGTTASIYGYGQGQNAYNNNLPPYPLPPIIMSVSHGTLTVEKIKTIEGMCDFWAPGITIINPIRYRKDYDWTNARFNKASLDYAGDPYYSYKYVRQQYFIRTMYELGIWSGEIVEEFGATKK